MPACGQMTCYTYFFADFRLCRIPVNTCTYLQSLVNCMEIPLERAGGYASKDRKEYT